MYSMCGIYCFYCKSENAYYIGQSTNINVRQQKHISQLRKNIHPNKKLQKAWNKCGENDFEFKILSEAPEEILNHLEDFYIKKYNSIKKGYNIQKGSLKYKPSLETNDNFTLDIKDNLMDFATVNISSILVEQKNSVLFLNDLKKMINLLNKTSLDNAILFDMLLELKIPVFVEVSLEDCSFNSDFAYANGCFGPYEKRIEEEDFKEFENQIYRLYIKDKNVILPHSFKSTIKLHNEKILKEIQEKENDKKNIQTDYLFLAKNLLDNLENITFGKIEETIKIKNEYNHHLNEIEKNIDLLNSQYIQWI